MYDNRKQVIPTIPYACVKPALICLPGSSRGFQLDPLDLHQGVTRDPLERSKGVHHVPPSEGVRGCSPHPLRFLHLWNAVDVPTIEQCPGILTSGLDVLCTHKNGKLRENSQGTLQSCSCIIFDLLESQCELRTVYSAV